MGAGQNVAGGREAKESSFRLVDFLVILLCLFGMAAGFYLFRQDLYRTLSSRNELPVGTITIKNNIVQRRMGDRVLWDRLFVESPVYIGDLIRVAGLSSATLNIDDNHIDLDENTIIRIIRSLDGEGAFQIELASGTINMASLPGAGSILVSVMGRQIKATPGAVFSITAGEDGMELRVSEGAVRFTGGDQEQELTATAMVAIDSNNMERLEKAVVVIRPRPNARLQQIGMGPMDINFFWRRHYLDPDEGLRLEIAGDRGFTRIFRTIDNLDTSADATLGAGQWHWRLSSADGILSAGHFSIAEDSSIPGPEAPVQAAPEIIPEPPARQEARPAAQLAVRQTPLPAPREAATAAGAQGAALLPAALNMRPPSGYRIGVEELAQRNIVFSWSPVNGANAYIFTLYQQGENGQRKLIQSATINRTGFTLENLSVLDIGEFAWQVEAVNRGSTGAINRRGSVGENIYFIDILLPVTPALHLEESPAVKDVPRPRTPVLRVEEIPMEKAKP